MSETSVESHEKTSEKKPHIVPRLPDVQAEIRTEDSTTRDEKIADVRDAIRTSVYKGEVGQFLARKRAGYEEEWNVDGEGRITYDELITSAIDRAIEDGRDNVTIFDFGCGEGGAMADLFNDKDGPVMKKIAEHPEIAVNFVGVTDSAGLSTPVTAEELLEGRYIKSPEEEPKNVSGRVDYLGVTAAQTLESYLHDHNITDIDVAMAVQSLNYLPADNFESTVQSIVSRLKTEGSTFIGAAYASRVPGFQRGPFESIRLDIPESSDSGLKTMLRDKSIRFDDPKTNIVEEAGNLKKALDMYVHLGALSQQDVDEVVTNCFSWTRKVWNKVTRHKADLLDLVETDDARRYLGSIADFLSKGENNLGQTRMKKLRERKEGTLTRLSDRLGESADVSFTDRVFTITRTEDAKVA